MTKQFSPSNAAFKCCPLRWTVLLSGATPGDLVASDPRGATQPTASLSSFRLIAFAFYSLSSDSCFFSHLLQSSFVIVSIVLFLHYKSSKYFYLVD